MAPTSRAATLLDELQDTDVQGIPSAETVVSPGTLDEFAEVVRYAADERRPVLIWGAGTHQDMGYPVEPSIVLTTRRLAGVIDFQPEDLTVVVGAGTRIGELSAVLAEEGRTAVLPEHADDATIGGVLSVGLSGYQRYRYGPVRDRVLQVELVTGDGRLVMAGGRVVKNVTGYDIPRLATGSFGGLGVIGTVCLKLWPEPAFTATVAVPDPARAAATAYRPLAVVETESGSFAYLGGTADDVRAQASKLGGEIEEGLVWPPPLGTAYGFTVRVPASSTTTAVQRVKQAGADEYRASHGVGEVVAGFDTPQVDQLTALRAWAEQVGGSIVATKGRLPGFDPWGSEPDSIDLQRRVKAAFDPVGVLNPGRLPGRI